MQEACIYCDSDMQESGRHILGMNLISYWCPLCDRKVLIEEQQISKTY